MFRRCFFQMWDNLVMLFCGNLGLAAVAFCFAFALQQATAHGPAAAFVSVLLVALGSYLVVLFFTAFLDHILREQALPFSPLRQIRRLAPFAAIGATSTLAAISLIAQLMNPDGGAVALAAAVFVGWLALVAGQILLFAGIRVACGGTPGLALKAAATEPFLNPVRSFAAVTAFAALFVTGLVGFPGLGGALVMMRAYLGLDAETRGRRDRIAFSTLVFPWRR